MNARSAVAVVILFTFPVSTLAQTPAARTDRTDTAEQPHLDLRSIHLTLDAPVNKAVVLPSLTVAHAFPQTQAVQPCAESEARGRADADAQPHKGAFWGGFAAGGLLSLYGFAVPVIMAAIKPKPSSIPQGLDANCYKNGYGSKARKDTALMSLWGTLAGFGTFLAILGIFAAADD